MTDTTGEAKAVAGVSPRRQPALPKVNNHIPLSSSSDSELARVFVVNGLQH